VVSRDTLRSLANRANAGVLRLWGRAEGPGGDAVIPTLGMLVLFVVLLSSSLRRASGPDAATGLAGDLQSAWLISTGAEPLVSVEGGVHALAPNMELIVYPLGWLSGAFDATAVLLGTQALLLSSAVLPLWLICRRDASLRVGAATVVLGVYALYPLVHTLNLTGFHPGVIAVPGLLWAAHGGLTGNRVLFLGAITAVALGGADQGLAVAGLGVSLWLVGRGSLGRVGVIAGGSWWVLASLGSMWVTGDDPAPLTPFRLVGEALGDPWAALTVLGSESSVSRLVVSLGPVLFLPLLAPRLLVGVLPVQVMAIWGDPSEEVVAARSAPLIAFVFLSTAFALSRLGRPGHDRVRIDRRLLVALGVAAMAFFVVDAPLSPYREPWTWGPNVTSEARLRYFDTVPSTTSVRASTELLAGLARRPDLAAIDDSAAQQANDVAVGAEAVMMTTDLWASWDPVRRRVFADTMSASGYELARGGSAPEPQADLVVWVRAESVGESP